MFNDDAAMLAWGWRVPFLLSSLLVVVGLLVRVHMEETPAFRAAQQSQRVVKAPAVEVFRTRWRQVLQATFLVAVTYTLFYTLATWSLDCRSYELLSRHRRADSYAWIQPRRGWRGRS